MRFWISTIAPRAWRSTANEDSDPKKPSQDDINSDGSKTHSGSDLFREIDMIKENGMCQCNDRDSHETRPESPAPGDWRALPISKEGRVTGSSRDSSNGVSRPTSTASGSYPRSYGDWAVEGLIKKGGMSSVHRVRHIYGGHLAALKTIRAEDCGDELGKRLVREIDILKGLPFFPHVISIYESSCQDDLIWYAMELVDGHSLDQVIANQSSQLSISQVCRYAIQAAQGIGWIHRAGIISRDIKPANLTLSRFCDLVKVIDFGIARRHFDPVTQLTTGIVGTLDYMSKEQIDDHRNVDWRADIYGLGATIYHLATGLPPFAHRETLMEKIKGHCEEQPRPLSQLRDDGSQALDQIVEAMMAKDRKDRPQSMADVVKCLKPLA